VQRRKVFILGDSHTTAIAEAVKLRLETGWDIDSPFDFFASRFSKQKANGSIVPGLSPQDAEALLSQAHNTDVLVCVLGGNQYNTLGLLEHAEPFDLIEPETRADPQHTAARIIPLAQMNAAFAAYVGSVRRSLSHHMTNFKGKTLYLNPPPPKSDNAYIKKNAEGYFRTEGKVRLNISPPDMRRRLWLTQSQALAQMCDDLDVQFVDNPDLAKDNGFLKRDCYGADATHANAYYGELVLQQLERLLNDNKVSS
jgi:hypothetical protein